MKKEYNTPKSVQHPETDDDVRRTLAMKVCKNCNVEKSVELFYFNRIKGRYFSECKECNIERSKKWNNSNGTRYKNNCRRHKEVNPERYAAYKKAEYHRNRDKYQASGKKYRQSQHGRSIRLHLSRARELRKANACPKWLTSEQLEAMKSMYLNRPKGYHVDHIVPLQGKNVCGLHVPWNLQYLPASDNIAKKNKF